MAYQELYSLSLGPDNGRVYFYKINTESTVIWEGNNPGVLRIRPHSHMVGWVLHKRIILYERICTLYLVWVQEPSIKHF